MNDNIPKALVIIIACVGTLVLVGVEGTLLPRFVWAWIILAAILVAAIAFCIGVIVKELRDGRNRK